MAGRHAGTTQRTCKIARRPHQLAVGDRAVDIREGELVAARASVAMHELGDAGDHLGSDHACLASCSQTMLKPPLMLITCPVIQLA